jgi:uncharacterized protein YkwD
VTPKWRNAGALALGVATGSLLVSGVVVAAAPGQVVPTLRTVLVARATPVSPSITSTPRSQQYSVVPVATALPTAAPGLEPTAAAGTLSPTAPLARPASIAAPSDRQATAVAVRADGPAPARASGRTGDVIALTNAERRKAGCRDLKPDSRLAAAAQAHAADMAEEGYFSHTGKDGRYFDERVRDAGYPRPGAENIAKGQSSAKDVVREWMASSSHRSAMLTCGFTTIGVGYDGRGNYWVQEFGK